MPPFPALKMRMGPAEPEKVERKGARPRRATGLSLRQWGLVPVCAQWRRPAPPRRCSRAAATHLEPVLHVRRCAWLTWWRIVSCKLLNGNVKGGPPHRQRRQVRCNQHPGARLARRSQPNTECRRGESQSLPRWHHSHERPLPGAARCCASGVARVTSVCAARVTSRPLGGDSGGSLALFA